MDEKLCRKCSTTKPRNDFYKSSRAGDGLQSWCKTCSSAVSSKWFEENRDRRREYVASRKEVLVQYFKEWNRKNRDKIRAKTEEKYYKSKIIVDDIKNRPCEDCGKMYPTCCMQFDHRDGSEKHDNVASMLGGKIDKLLKEIAKCDVVCSNCHAIRTAIRRKLARESRDRSMVSA